MRPIDRRAFIAASLAAATVPAAQAKRRRPRRTLPHSAVPIPDDGWRLWVDEKASWQDDVIHLPGEFDLTALPINPPTGGWQALHGGKEVSLPGTVEQHFWGRFGLRSYDVPHEYAWHNDPVPQNGAWRGVSWWWRDIEIPAALKGRRLILTVRGARLRAEVFLNQKLVGYSILEELPFDCDVTEAADPGGANRLAIRITNPGGRYDWIDGDTLDWGTLRIQRSHGFGGLDRGLALAAHPVDGRISDLWVLNTPERRTVHAFVKLEGDADPKGLAFDVVEDGSGFVLPVRIRPDGRRPDGAYKFVVTARTAKIWSLSKPTLYRLRTRWISADGSESVRSVDFGFRWFTTDGIGKNAVLRLNGRRIKLYTAISWGYWGLNGLWPTPELAEKEVTQAKAFGLNCLNFHRNVGKEDVFRAQDRLGLLRCMEPGGGKLAQGKLPDGTRVDAHSIVMQKPVSEADIFCQRYMVAKCVAMVRAFRSHPSLIQYTLQNEANADFSDPSTMDVLAAMRAEDDSRIILMNDGMVAPPVKAAQAWYAPYDPVPHRSDKEPWGGWWDNHQGAGDQWYDAFYKDSQTFNYRNPLKPAIVDFGEMEGCAVPDNHVKAIADIAARGGTSYDLADHRDILAGYDAFLDRWNFRAVFPTSESLFLALGRKCYDSWQEYLENARLNDATDCSAISGWESTAIENHSGLVDNLRNFKSDPAIIRASLQPIRPVAKQRSLAVAVGGRAVFDLYLLNDTGRALRGALHFTMTDPAGRNSRIGRFAVPRFRPDQFCTLVRSAVASPPLLQEGLYRFELALPGAPTQVREIWVCDDNLAPGRSLKIGVSGVLARHRSQLERLHGVTVEDFGPGCDVIVCSGLTEHSTPAQKLGGDEGLDLQRSTQSTPAPGELPAAVMAAVKAGTPLLVIAPEDGLADGVARQLAAAGAFSYDGQVGPLRAPWMGNWYFLREHPVYAGIPVNQAMGVLHQAHGRQANGLVVDGADVDAFVGYSRDHDRRVGAGTFTAKLGSGKLLFQRVPDLNGPMQQRFLRNALAWLCG